ncbi:MAG: hypothetical protein P8105_05880, partial [Dehalococcoidia bacterium]
MSIYQKLLALFCGLLLTMALMVAGIAVTVNMTVLNPNFMVKEIDKFDIYTTITDQIKNELQAQELYGFSDLIGLDVMIDDILRDTRPWFEEQTRFVVYEGITYLKSKEDLNITISLAPLKASIDAQINDKIDSFLPPGMEELPVDIDIPSLVDMTGIPDSYTISESTLDPGMVYSLHLIKRIVAYLKLAYILSVLFAIVAIAGTGWTQQWRMRSTARYLGTPFILCGIACTLLALGLRISNAIARHFTQNVDLAFDFQVKIATFIADITLPLLIYGIVVLLTGIALIIVAVIYG